VQKLNTGGGLKKNKSRGGATHVGGDVSLKGAADPKKGRVGEVRGFGQRREGGDVESGNRG